MKQHLTFYVDGWCKGNPGPMGSTVVCDNYTTYGRKPTAQKHEYGLGTNNEAEYLAVIEALRWARNLILPTGSEVKVLTDSQLVDGHYNKQWTVNRTRLMKRLQEVHVLVRALEHQGVAVTVAKVPRNVVRAMVGH